VFTVFFNEIHAAFVSIRDFWKHSKTDLPVSTPEECNQGRQTWH